MSNELGERIAKVEVQMGRLVSDRESEKCTFARVHTELVRRLEHLEELLDGNGRPGLKAEVLLTGERLSQLAALVEQHVRAERQEVESLKRLAWKLLGGLVMAQVVVLPALWMALQKLWK